MASIIKNLFRSKKPKNRSIEVQDEYSHSDHGSPSEKVRRHPSNRDYPLSTAAYYTSTKSRHHRRAPRSCPGDISDDPDYFIRNNHSFVSELQALKYHHRNRPSSSERIRRAQTTKSEYDMPSERQSLVTAYSTYNYKLNDSDSDTWNAEYERAQRVRELEVRLRDQRNKAKEYRERLRSERDLRLMNERSLMEEVERYKRDLKREQRERKAIEQRYLEIINSLKSRIQLLEQQRQQQPLQQHQQCYHTPSVPILSSATIASCNGLTHKSGAGDLLYSMSNSSLLAQPGDSSLEPIERDEIKNFRNSSSGLLEMARADGGSSSVSSSTLHDRTNSTILQHNQSIATVSRGKVDNNDDGNSDDNFDENSDGYTTTSEGFSKCAIVKTSNYKRTAV